MDVVIKKISHYYLLHLITFWQEIFLNKETCLIIHSVILPLAYRCLMLDYPACVVFNITSVMIVSLCLKEAYCGLEAFPVT